MHVNPHPWMGCISLWLIAPFPSPFTLAAPERVSPRGAKRFWLHSQLETYWFGRFFLPSSLHRDSPPPDVYWQRRSMNISRNTRPGRNSATFPFPSYAKSLECEIQFLFPNLICRSSLASGQFSSSCFLFSGWTSPNQLTRDQDLELTLTNLIRDRRVYLLAQRT